VIEMHRLSMMVGPVKGFVEAGCPGRHADLLAAFGLVSPRDLVFREDGFKRAFGDAGPAVDAGVRVDVKPRPFVNRFAGDDAFYRAYIYTPRVAQTQAGNNVSHRRNLPMGEWIRYANILV
jgi:hypothetical protein